MKRIIIVIILFGMSINAFSQRVVFDQKHFQIVNENGAARYASENTHNQFLTKIDENLQNINTNAGTIVIAQTIIYNSLANVNSALKNGLAIRNLSAIIADIIRYSRQMAEMAKSEPYLLLFAEEMASSMKYRSTQLLTDVSGFILNDKNILADYNSRDQLIRKITQELQIMSGLVYGAWKSMFYAKQRGILRSVNPYENFINSDRQFVEQIIRNSKYLKE